MKDLFDTVAPSPNRLAGRGKKPLENYVCKGCSYLSLKVNRCYKWGGKCKPDDPSCAFYTTMKRKGNKG